MNRRTWKTLTATALAAVLSTSLMAGDDPAVQAFKVGKIVTMDGDDRVINNGVLLVEDGKIKAIGKASKVAIPDDATVLEMAECWLVPGLVELHNHTGAGGGGDLHDYVYLTNPGLRSLDAVAPDPYAQHDAQAGGVTTALVIPGSGTNMSGFGTVIKFKGDSVDDMVLKFPGSVKIAQAGNPERYWWGVGRSFMNYNTRRTLENARSYHAAWERHEQLGGPEPTYDPTFDDFREMYRRNFIASVHTQGFQLVMTTLDMLARKLEIKTVLDHSTFDGFKNAGLVTEMEGDVITINGPRQFHFDRTERKIHGNAARWWQGGVRKLGINTDSPVIPQRELSYQAAIACWYGWKPYEALAGMTRVGAEALMVDDRVGSIEIGKDADFGIWSGDPVDPRSTCWITVVDGVIVYDGREERRF